MPKEFLGAFKRGHRMNSKEFIDEELAERLLDKALNGDEEASKALAWLSKFNNEFHKNVIKKGDKDALHSTDELRRSCYAREYARQNDMFTFANRVDIPTDSIDFTERQSFFARKYKK